MAELMRLLCELVIDKEHGREELPFWLYGWAGGEDGDELTVCPYCEAHGWSLTLQDHKLDCVAVWAFDIARAPGGGHIREVRHVLRQLLAWKWVGLDPDFDDTECMFCEASAPGSWNPDVPHKPDCLLERIKRALESA